MASRLFLIKIKIMMDNNKQKPLKWAAIKFKSEERDLIRATWQKLVEGEGLDFG